MKRERKKEHKEITKYRRTKESREERKKLPMGRQLSERTRNKKKEHERNNK